MYMRTVFVCFFAAASPAAQAHDMSMSGLAEWALERFLDDIVPEFETFRQELEDLSLYELPEILPNGDIIIRRKRPDLSEPTGPIDL